MTGSHTQIIVENELLWPTWQMEHRLNDHPRGALSAMHFMLFMGSARRVRVTSKAEREFGSWNRYINFFDAEEIESIYETRTKPLVAEITGSKHIDIFENSWLYIDLDEFITMYIYASKYRLPLVWDLQIVNQLKKLRRASYEGSHRIGNLPLLSALINLLSCYSHVTPYCLRPTEPNVDTADELLAELFRQSDFLRLSRLMRRLGFARDKDYIAPLQRTESLSRSILRSELLSRSYTLTKSFVSLWGGPSSVMAFAAAERLIDVLAIKRYIPPIYDIRQIHKAYDEYHYPGVDYGGY